MLWLLELDLAKKNSGGFKEISNLSFKYMEFLLTRNHICNWCCSSNHWDFFGRKAGVNTSFVFLKQFRQFHFLKPLDIFVKLFSENGTSAKKVTLMDAKEDVDKICIEVQTTSDNAGGKPTRGFSLQHKTFSTLNYAQDFGTTVKESLKRTTSSKRATLTK